MTAVMAAGVVVAVPVVEPLSFLQSPPPPPPFTPLATVPVPVVVVVVTLCPLSMFKSKRRGGGGGGAGACCCCLWWEPLRSLAAGVGLGRDAWTLAVAVTAAVRTGTAAGLVACIHTFPGGEIPLSCPAPDEDRHGKSRGGGGRQRREERERERQGGVRVVRGGWQVRSLVYSWSTGHLMHGA